MDLRRIVQVWAGLPEGDDEVGSGYLVAPAVVLTAHHVVEAAADGEVLVQSHFGSGWVSRSIRTIVLGKDAALLVLPEERSGSGTRPQIGSLGSSARVIRAVLVGYPQSALIRPPIAPHSLKADLPDSGEVAYRRDTQLSGEIATATGFGDDTLTFLVSPGEISASSAPGASIFAGLSGAAIFTQSDLLVGIVTVDPDPERPTRLVGIRVAQVMAQLEQDTAAEVAELLGIDRLFRFPDASIDATRRAVMAAHSWQVRTVLDAIPNGHLKGRGRELAELALWCGDDDRPYFVWLADAWHGKSAVMATFTAEPPAGVDIVAFFINANDPESRDVDHYLTSVIGQLEAFLGETVGSGVAVGSRRARSLDLLSRAADVALGEGRRLVLVVDGLDEDIAWTTPGSISIASILPTGIRNLHVLVATRPYANVLTATVSHHPFRARSARRSLSRSDSATDIHDRAERQIQIATVDPEGSISRDILGFMWAARSPLTIGDLSALVSCARPDDSTITDAAIRNRVLHHLRDTVRRRHDLASVERGTVGEEPFEWSHETLPRTVRNELGGSAADRYSCALRKWARNHVGRGWTADTPPYLESGYPGLLTESGSSQELFELAVDRDRQGWLFRRRGGNDQAINDVSNAFHLHRSATIPDIARLVVLAFERDRLSSRSRMLPPALPATWVFLKQPGRAVALARSIIDDSRRTDALGGVAMALATAGQPGKALQVTEMITSDGVRAQVLADVTKALAAAGRVDEAGRIAGEAWRVSGALTNYSRALLLVDVARAFAAAGRAEEVRRTVDEAERVIDAITDDDDRTRVLAKLTKALATAGWAEEAERVADTLTHNHYRAVALADVAKGLAEAGRADEYERTAWKAERIADAITSDVGRGWTLAEIAQRLAVAGRTQDAIRIAEEAEGIARSIADNDGRSTPLAGVAVALAAAGRVDEAARIMEEVGRSAETYGLLDWLLRTELAGVAEVVAMAGRAEEARKVARLIASDGSRARVLANVAKAMASAGLTEDARRTVEEAERAASTLTDAGSRAAVLADVAGALAAAGLIEDAGRAVEEAERAASTLTDAGSRAAVLADVAGALAAAGLIEDAGRIAEEAELVAGTANEGNRAIALAEFANALTVVGRVEEAGRIADEAERVATIGAQDSNDQDTNTSVLRSVARALAAAGRSEAAERVAGMIIGNDYRVRAFVVVAKALAEAGRTEDSGRVAEEAERIARAIGSSFWRSLALADVAGAFAVAGRVEQAGRTAEEAARVAGRVTDDNSLARANALAAVARHLAAAGRTGDAGRTAEEAARVAAMVADDGTRSLAMAEAAGAFAVAGRVEEARRTADEAARVAGTLSDDDSRARAEALITVADALAAAGRAEEAERVAEMTIALVADHTLWAKALSVVARRLAAAGRVDEAERIADAIIYDVAARAVSLADVAGALAAHARASEAERVAAEATRVTDTLDDESRAWALADVAQSLAAAGLSTKAQSICLDSLFQNQWPSFFRVLLALALGNDGGDNMLMRVYELHNST